MLNQRVTVVLMLAFTIVCSCTSHMPDKEIGKKELKEIVEKQN